MPPRRSGGRVRSSSASTAAATALIGARVVASTKKGYTSNLTQLRNYYVNELGCRDITLPVREDDIIGF